MVERRCVYSVGGFVQSHDESILSRGNRGEYPSIGTRSMWTAA